MAVHTSFDRLIVDLTEASFVIHSALAVTLDAAAQRVKQTAEEKFGSYQPATGPFVGWAALSSEYVMQKGSEDPLIGLYNSAGMSGRRDTVGNGVALGKSIETTVDKTILEAHVGTNNILGLWHEYGLPDRQHPLSPRPFLRPALYQNIDWILAAVGESVGSGLKSTFK